MAKRKRRKRRKWSVGFFLVMGAGLAGFIAVAGWWLFISDSDSPAKKACLARISVIVDRADQLGRAWNNRSGPAEPSSSPEESRSGETPVKTRQSGRDRDREPPPQKTVQAPEDQPTEKDKEALRDLLRELNQPE